MINKINNFMNREKLKFYINDNDKILFSIKSEIIYYTTNIFK